MEKIESLGLRILPLSKEVLSKSTGLLARYPKLNVFDSIHLAHAILEGERILSIDRVFDLIEEVVKVDQLSGSNIPQLSVLQSLSPVLSPNQQNSPASISYDSTATS